jgi:lipid-binding SYLF domain-containing protein
MRIRTSITVLIFVFCAVLFMPSAWATSKATQQRAEIDRMSVETLELLYKTEPSARQFIANSAGYAVFNNFGTKILVAGGGHGKGVAIDNKTQHRTYMRMLELQAGLGFGIKRYRLVWVFERVEDFNKFINSGWELSGQATAAAKYEKDGKSYQGAIDVSDGVWLYQLTDKGLALELTVKGSKYYQDKDLN